MGSIVRGKILRSDLALWDGKNATSTRVDATSGTITGLQLNDYVDVLQVFGGGTARTVGTIDSAISFIGGSSKVALLFSPGTWTIDVDVTIGSNFTCLVMAGAVFDVASGRTLTLSGPVIRQSVTWTSGLGTVTNSLGSATLIDLQDSGANYTATTVEAAFTELASTSAGEGASIIGLEDSGANYAAANVEAAFAELASVSNGEGASIIGVEDSAGNLTATDVEAALAEIFASLLDPTKVLIFGGTPQTLTGPGAVNLTTAITHIVTTGTDALTLADGTEGQRKFLVMKTDAGDATLTPSSLGNGTTITFDDVGDSADLLFTNASWHFMGGTATLA
jgi:hypothetical protein